MTPEHRICSNIAKKYKKDIKLVERIVKSQFKYVKKQLSTYEDKKVFLQYLGTFSKYPQYKGITLEEIEQIVKKKEV